MRDNRFRAARAISKSSDRVICSHHFSSKAANEASHGANHGTGLIRNSKAVLNIMVVHKKVFVPALENDDL